MATKPNSQKNQKPPKPTVEAAQPSCLPQFTYKQKTYQIKLPKMNIPGIGVVTAADVATDESAQEYLVKNNTLGSAIDLVVE